MHVFFNFSLSGASCVSVPFNNRIDSDVYRHFDCELFDFYSGDEIKKTEMGRACNTYGGEDRRIKGLVRES